MSRTKWSSESIRGGKDSKRGCLQNSLYFATLAVCTIGFLITTYGTMSKYFSDSKLTSMYYQVLWPHLNSKTKLILYLLTFQSNHELPLPHFVFCYRSSYKSHPTNQILSRKGYLESTMDPQLILLDSYISGEGSSPYEYEPFYKTDFRAIHTYFSGRCLCISYRFRVCIVMNSFLC